jgi:hypothetical protein
MSGSGPGERRGGRQPGTPNKRTEALARAQAEASERVTQALGPDGFQGDALSFLQLIYRDTSQATETRLHAARIAVGYERPRLAAVQVENNVTTTQDLSSEQFAAFTNHLDEIVRRLASEI